MEPATNEMLQQLRSSDHGTQYRAIQKILNIVSQDISTPLPCSLGELLPILRVLYNSEQSVLEVLQIWELLGRSENYREILLDHVVPLTNAEDIDVEGGQYSSGCSRLFIRLWSTLAQSSRARNRVGSQRFFSDLVTTLFKLANSFFGDDPTLDYCTKCLLCFLRDAKYRQLVLQETTLLSKLHDALVTSFSLRQYTNWLTLTTEIAIDASPGTMATLLKGNDTSLHLDTTRVYKELVWTYWATAIHRNCERYLDHYRRVIVGVVLKLLQVLQKLESQMIEPAKENILYKQEADTQSSTGSGRQIKRRRRATKASTTAVAVDPGLWELVVLSGIRRGAKEGGKRVWETIQTLRATCKPLGDHFSPSNTVFWQKVILQVFDFTWKEEPFQNCWEESDGVFSQAKVSESDSEPEYDPDPQSKAIKHKYQCKRRRAYERRKACFSHLMDHDSTKEKEDLRCWTKPAVYVRPSQFQWLADLQKGDLQRSEWPETENPYTLFLFFAVLDDALARTGYTIEDVDEPSTDTQREGCLWFVNPCLLRFSASKQTKRIAMDVEDLLDICGHVNVLPSIETSSRLALFLVRKDELKDWRYVPCRCRVCSLPNGMTTNSFREEFCKALASKNYRTREFALAAVYDYFMEALAIDFKALFPAEEMFSLLKSQYDALFAARGDEEMAIRLCARILDIWYALLSQSQTYDEGILDYLPLPDAGLQGVEQPQDILKASTSLWVTLAESSRSRKRVETPGFLAHVVTTLFYYIAGTHCGDQAHFVKRCCKCLLGFLRDASTREVVLEKTPLLAKLQQRVADLDNSFCVKALFKLIVEVASTASFAYKTKHKDQRLLLIGNNSETKTHVKKYIWKLWTPAAVESNSTLSYGLKAIKALETMEKLRTAARKEEEGQLHRYGTSWMADALPLELWEHFVLTGIARGARREGKRVWELVSALRCTCTQLANHFSATNEAFWRQAILFTFDFTIQEGSLNCRDTEAMQTYLNVSDTVDSDAYAAYGLDSGVTSDAESDSDSDAESAYWKYYSDPESEDEETKTFPKNCRRSSNHQRAFNEWGSSNSSPDRYLKEDLRCWTSPAMYIRPSQYQWLTDIQQGVSSISEWPEDEKAYTLFQDLALVGDAMARIGYTIEGEPCLETDHDESKWVYPCLLRSTREVKGSDWDPSGASELEDLLDLCGFAPHLWRNSSFFDGTNGMERNARRRRKD